MGIATLDNNELVQWVHRSHVIQHVIILARFIDDIICILIVRRDDGMDDDEVNNLIADFDRFGQGILTWDADESSQTVDYQD
jgi:hypothetical protein